MTNYDDIAEAFERRWNGDEQGENDDQRDRISEIDEELQEATKIDFRKLSEKEREDLVSYINQLKAERDALEHQGELDYSDEVEYEKTQGGPSLPADSPSAVLYRVQTEADIPRAQKKQLNSVRQLFGLHVPLSNTMRKDNLRHINTYSLAEDYIKIPKLRHLGVERMGATTTELQLCRSNEEVGGFERKAQISMIKRESMNVAESKPTKKLSLSERFLGVKKQPQEAASPREA